MATLDEVRVELAAAASTVAGVDCTPYFRQTTKSGAGWVRLDRSEFTDQWSRIDHWHVVVLLVQDVATAEKKQGVLIPALYGALSAVTKIDRITAANIILESGGTGSLPCLIVESHRAEEN